MSDSLQAKSRSDAFAVTSDMTPAENALQSLLQNVAATEDTELVPLAKALGRVLAEPLQAKHNIPPYDNSAVDGYAVRFEDLSAGQSTELSLSARITAGDNPDIPLLEGQAAQIFTGAPIPQGANMVIPFEVCEAQKNSVLIPAVKTARQNIRPLGEDVQAGQTILTKGIGLRPQDIAFAASVGCHQLTLFRTLSVAVFSTGNEISDPSEELEPGARYDANRFLLRALCERLGCQVMDLGILKDDPESIRKTFADVTEKYDLVLTTGGVSSSEEDHVKQAFEAAGGALKLWKVAIRPGRPLAWGQIGKTYFMGLPGNPVAAFVTFSIFTRSLILKMAGVSDWGMTRLPVRADFDLKKRVGRREWLRVWVKVDERGQLYATKFPSEGSGILSSVVNTDGLLELPDELDFVRKGMTLDFLPFTPFATF